MLTRVIISLALFGVLIQSTPLRACAVEEQITGTSCHGHSGDQDNLIDDHCGDPGPCDRGPSCQCQQPRIDADKANRAAMPDLLPPHSTTISVANDVSQPSLGTIAAPARPPDSPLAVQLPLLI